jgi:hypothetical protein
MGGQRVAGKPPTVHRQEGDGVGVHVSGNSPGVLLSDQVAAQDTNQPGWTTLAASAAPSDRSEELIVAVKLACERSGW